MASSSSAATRQSQMPVNYHPYPPPLARYEDVVASSKLFMDTLGKLHGTMGTKFKIPVIGGKELNLHRLFVEVTSRGGFGKVRSDKRWKEITAIFSFPSSATNASFILKKYYASLLQHYEQIYYFKAKGWIPSADGSQNVTTIPASNNGLNEPALPPSTLREAPLQARIDVANSITGATSATLGTSLVGVIDGKFDNGYLVTVTIGSEQLKGVLYQTPKNPSDQMQPTQTVVPNINENATTSTGVLRRRRRKKCEMKRRDPAHPKPNRSGYNFFFAEQHARLKPLYPGKDRDISRMIGESWNKLNDTDRAVYQEKAVRDKERYRLEMEEYRARQKMGQVTNSVLAINQQPHPPVVNVMGMDETIETEGGESPKTPENDLSSEKSDKSNFEDDPVDREEIDMEKTLVGVEIEAENVGMENAVVKNGQKGEECLKDDRTEKELALLDGGESIAKRARIEKEPEVLTEDRVAGEVKD